MYMTIVYEDGDLLDATDIADYFGYSREYVLHMLNINHRGANPALLRLRIESTPEWRQTMGRRARYVFLYEEVKAWHDAHQRKPSVKRKVYARRHMRS